MNSSLEAFRLPDQILLLVLPMFHIFGLVVGTFSTLFSGMTVAVLPRYDFVTMLTAIQTYRATYLPLVPPIFIALAKQDLVLNFDLSSLKQIVCAAAPLGKETMDSCATRFPKVKLQQGYALTESTCAGTASPLDDIHDIHLMISIKYNTHQVAPAELEALLLCHPGVLDCAVIPFPNERAGQIPMACIVRRLGHEFSEDEVMEWVRKKVAPYKKVQKVAFINAIPKYAAGKILRRELVQLTKTKSRL